MFRPLLVQEERPPLPAELESGPARVGSRFFFFFLGQEKTLSSIGLKPEAST